MLLRKRLANIQHKGRKTVYDRTLKNVAIQEPDSEPQNGSHDVVVSGGPIQRTLMKGNSNQVNRNLRNSITHVY